MPLPASSTLTTLSIPLLLEWWQKRKRLASSYSNLHATLPKGDDLYLQAYYRLMEVYSVVKSGGVKAQIEAIQAFAERESDALQQRLVEIEAAAAMSECEKQQKRQIVAHELNELRSANSWRLQALMGIAAEEEIIVERYLPDIERTLMQAQCA
ncbi:MAG: hypothetical protein WBD47_22330 [Phormidesmis sp.]